MCLPLLPLHPAGVRARRALLDPRLSDDPAPPPSPAAVEGEATLTPALCEQRITGIKKYRRFEY